jgi:hypothetical protein
MFMGEIKKVTSNLNAIVQEDVVTESGKVIHTFRKDVGMTRLIRRALE